MNDVWAARRTRVREQIGDRGALVVAAGPELGFGRDGEIRYTPDPDLYYLSGYTEPEAVMVLAPGDAPFTMFVRPRDPDRELWTGPRGGIEAARERFGADAAWPIAELREKLPKLLAEADTIFARVGTGRADVDALILDALAAGRRSRPRRGRGPHSLVDSGTVLDEMRLIKDATEIEKLRAAARLTVEAFAEAVAQIRPGAGEWEVEASLEYAFRKRGASGPAFPTIVASGPNATVLHYTENARVMQAGELVLIDAGARLDMYCADVSRTVPVSSGTGDARRALYEAVRAAHDGAIEAVTPGAPAAAPQEAAQRILVEALIGIGLIDGPLDAALEDAERTRRLLPHRVSHWLGLEVHDPGGYVDADGAPRILAPGMVLTIEPGVYVPPDLERAPVELRGTGIRIEDDVLVTAAGAEVLTAGLPI